MEALDQHLFRLINGLAGRFAFVDWLVAGHALMAPLTIALMLCAYWLAPADDIRRRRRAIVYSLLSCAVALALNWAVARQIPRERPFVASPSEVTQLLTHAADNAFASNHATGAFAVALPILFTGLRGGRIFLAVAVGTAFSRVYAGLHWPGDVAGGLAVAVIATIVVGLTRPWTGPLVGALLSTWEQLTAALMRPRLARFEKDLDDGDEWIEEDTGDEGKDLFRS